MSYRRLPELPAPSHHAAVVLNVVDNRHVDLVLPDVTPVVIPNVECLPGMDLKRGYRVVMTTWGVEYCVTAVVGCWSEEQLDALLEV